MEFAPRAVIPPTDMAMMEPTGQNVHQQCYVVAVPAHSARHDVQPQPEACVVPHAVTYSIIGHFSACTVLHAAAQGRAGHDQHEANPPTTLPWLRTSYFKRRVSQTPFADVSMW